MKDRLSKIITSEGLTAALLADELGVQSSGIRHILTGRNNPSFDLLQKLLARFPKLNAEWLITGQGSMYKLTATDAPEIFAPPAAPTEKTPLSPTLPEKQPDLPPAEDNKKTLPDEAPKILPTSEPKKTVEKMMILYSDKTFATYSPEG